MITRPSRIAVSACLLGALFASSQASAQQPGTAAVVSMTLPASAEPVQGWSMRHGLMGRPVYASPDGKQIGTVVDVIVTSAAAPYVLIIGVGGFLEVGGHAVAIPRDDLVEQGGLLVMPGASRASLKAMPRFTYSQATIQRAQFIRATSMQLARANAQLARLQRKATAASGAARVQLEQDNAAFQADITAAEDKLADLEKAEAARWALLREDVEKAIARVRAGMGHPKAVPAAARP
ncbi:PRC-barrel domain-containing protein [Massilia sp. S19_KUP03_FR1]|uniref:PRC-barrel domain-containing protein n=1 Tax=Massilia sp. S19_KUP03_FR1 TaxID=3025503 RepID=UPI002FCDA887